MIASALKTRISDAHLQAPDTHTTETPISPGGRLLAHHELQRQAIDLLLEFVDALVPQDDQVGGLRLAVDEGVHRALQRPRALLRHFPDRLTDQVHVVLQARFEPLAIVIPGPQEPGSADKYMAKDRALWEPLVRALNITLD